MEYDDESLEIFAARFRAESWRGYGPNARSLLGAVARGGDWSELSKSSFDGEGSFGNGGAMRVAPVGAYHAENPDAVVAAADRSARITHAHPEGRAGAIAVATATSVAHETRKRGAETARRSIYESVVERTPEGETRRRIREARDYGVSSTVREIAEAYGSGKRVTAMDTVPFVIWCATCWCDDFEEALWRTVAGGGDRDTTCAMVGGIVSQRTGLDDVGEEWFERREELDWEVPSE